VPPNGDFVRDVLGGRVTEQIQLDDGTISAQWLHFTNKGYDLVYTRDWTGTRGRLHHVAFAPDTREDIIRAADICLDHGVFIETGPHKHAIQQTFFLYVYEPGGTGSSCATRSPGWCWRRTGARSPGRRPNGPGARPGA
jgi:Glyoxalase/Bleomycin resistance protein/Dioxygenase superfamily.